MWSARTSHLEEWHTNVCACGSDSKDSDVTCECLCAWPCQLSARGRQGSPDPGLPTRLFPLHTGAHGFLGFVWPLRAQGYLGAHANPWVERVTSAPPVFWGSGRLKRKQPSLKPGHHFHQILHPKQTSWPDRVLRAPSFKLTLTKAVCGQHFCPKSHFLHI